MWNCSFQQTILNIQSHSKRYPEEPNSALFPSEPSLFVSVGQVRLFSQPPPSICRSKKEKGMKRPSHWLTTDPWLGIENLCLQIKLSGFKEQRCHSPAPGRSVSLTGFQRLTRIFLSCQGRVTRAKDYRGAQRSLTNIKSLKYLIVLEKKHETLYRLCFSSNISLLSKSLSVIFFVLVFITKYDFEFYKGSVVCFILRNKHFLGLFYIML